MLKRIGIAGAALSLVALVASVHGAETEEAGFRKNVGDYSLYLSVMPAEVIRGPVAPDDPAASPYRRPAARETHHVMVSIFGLRDGKRITDAGVMARVAALGFSGEKKALEPTTVAGAAVFGGFFSMMGRGPYRVDVEFRVPAAARRQHASFYFTHPSFKAPMRGARSGSTGNE